MLACVCAYFHTHALVWEDIEVVEVRKEGKEVDVKKVDPPLDREVGECRAVCFEAYLKFLEWFGIDVLRGDVDSHQDT